MWWFTSLLLLLWFFDFENLLIMCFDVGLWIHLLGVWDFLVGKWSNIISSMFLSVLSSFSLSCLPPSLYFWTPTMHILVCLMVSQGSLRLCLLLVSIHFLSFTPDNFQIPIFLFWPCCAACGILVSQPGIKSRPWQWKHWGLTSSHLGNSPNSYFQIHWFFLLPAQICLWNPLVNFSFQ